MISRRSSFLIRLFLSVALLGGWTSAWSQDKFVYLTSVERQGVRSDEVVAFTINAVTGALTPVPGFFPAGAFPSGVGVDPFSRFLYVANEESNDVSAFTIHADGSLTPVQGAPFALGFEFLSVATAP